MNAEARLIRLQCIAIIVSLCQRALHWAVSRPGPNASTRPAVPRFLSRRRPVQVGRYPARMRPPSPRARW